MADPMRIRAMENGGTTDVKILMKHDMETGQRKDAVSYTHLTLPTIIPECRSRWSPYH